MANSSALDPKTVTIPVGIITWQIKTAPVPQPQEGTDGNETADTWGPYLCLPIDGGTYSLPALASKIQELLQSTIREDEHIEWSVWLVAGTARLGFAISRRQARQVVRHGHVEVNGRKVNIPSYQVNVGDEVAIRDSAKKLDRKSVV